MEIGNTQTILLFVLTFINGALTMILLTFLSQLKNKSITRVDSEEDFYCKDIIEDKKKINKKKNSDVIIFDGEIPMQIEDSNQKEKAVKKKKHRIAFIGKNPGKRKSIINNKKKGGKK